MKITKLDALIIWSGFRSIPPKNFANISEIRSAGVMMDKMFEVGKPLTESVKKAENELRELEDEELQSRAREINTETAKLEKEHGEKEVEVEMGEDLEAEFKDFLKRWAMYWFPNIHNLLAFQERTGYNLDSSN